jgi:hypothetical protein
MTGGIFKVTQPDGLTVQGNATAVELRTATDGTFQNGLYTFTYIVQATGYTPTTVTKSFFLTYHSVAIELTELADAFTPSIQLLDSTFYDDVDGFDPPTITRAWNGAIRYVGDQLHVLTGTNALLDMAGEDGHYYDAAYSASLATTLVYTHSLQTWFSVKETLTATAAFDVYIPPSLQTLRNGLDNLKAQIEAGTYCGARCGCGIDYTPFNTAQSIYNLFVSKGHGGDLYGLFPYIDQLQKIFTCNGLLFRTHTYSNIPQYNWEAASNGSGSDAHEPIRFTVGSGLLYAPAEGDVDYINPDIAPFRIKQIYVQSIADFLDSTAWQRRTEGGFTLLGGATFHTDEKYTLNF